VAKDPKPENGGAPRGGTGSSSSGQRPGGLPGKGAGGRSAGSRGPQGKGAQGKGRTRPPANVVAPQKPWGLIAGAVAVAVFAVAVLGYAVVQVNRSNEDQVTDPDQIADLQTFDYASGQEHVTTEVDYTESPPVGGPHDAFWADCTGTVYDVDIRHENAVHSMEHGATWITYDPETIGDDDLSTLEELVDGRSGLLLSPYAGLGSTISLQSWNHQLAVDSASDVRVEQYVDLMTFNDEFYPEVGASCEQPAFIADPVVEGSPSEAVGESDAPTTATPTAESTPATETSTAP
jgi:hypothetical protein